MSDEQEVTTEAAHDAPRAYLGKEIPYGKVIKDDKEVEKDQLVLEHVGYITPVLDLVNKDKSVKTLIRESLCLTPVQIEQLTANQIRKYILVMPQALIHYQDCLARAINKLREAENTFDDVIAKPASLLTKDDFPKGSSPPTGEMKQARMRELFPEQYAKLIALVRERKAIVTRMEGQIKNIQIASDNLKKVFGTYYRAAQSED